MNDSLLKIPYLITTKYLHLETCRETKKIVNSGFSQNNYHHLLFIPYKYKLIE